MVLKLFHPTCRQAPCALKPKGDTRGPLPPAATGPPLGVTPAPKRMEAWGTGNSRVGVLVSLSFSPVTSSFKVDGAVGAPLPR